MNGRFSWNRSFVAATPYDQLWSAAVAPFWRWLAAILGITPDAIGQTSLSGAPKICCSKIANSVARTRYSLQESSPICDSGERRVVTYPPVHGRIAFFPFRRITLKRPKPDDLAEAGDSLATHLCRVRRARGLKQSDVATLLGVNENSIGAWEAGKLPYDRMYPSIIASLGYEPWSAPESLAESLQAERRRRGLSAKATAQLLDVDEATYAGWERAQVPTLPRHHQAIKGFLSESGLREAPAEANEQ